MIKLKKLIIYTLNLPLYFLSNFINKKDNIWLFGSWYGKNYSDNSKYLFEYINKYQPDIRAIWITDNKEVIKLLKEKKYEVYKRYSIKSIIIGLQAKYSIYVLTNFTDSLAFLNNKKTKNINLWHGIPLKKIGFDNKYINLEKIINLKKTLLPFLDINNDLMIACSKEDQKHFISAFKNSNVKITGYPRNDILNNKFINKKLIITYLPTCRNEQESNFELFDNFDFKIEKWEITLNKINANLIIKNHFYNNVKVEFLNSINKSENIEYIQKNTIDVMDILTNTDILITDYSSVYFDFLLTEKPIIFASFDYQDYIKKDKELYYNYTEVTPGPKCQNWNEVLKWVIEFSENPNLYKEERKIIKDKFHKYQDNLSCKRVFDEINNL